MAANTKFGKIVWAKVKGSCPWPAKGVSATVKRPVKKGNWFFVRFYGSNDHAWVDYDNNIWSYKEYRMRFGEKDKAPQLFREAVEQADFEYSTLSLADLPSSDSDLSPHAEQNKQKSSKSLAGKAPKAPKAAKITASVNPTPPTKPLPDAKKQPKGANARKRRQSETGSNGVVEIKKSRSQSPLEDKKDDFLTSDSGDSSPSKLTRTNISAKYLADSPHRRTQVKANVFDFDEADMTSSILSNKKTIKPVNTKIGFIGLGVMGMPMVKNLIKHGHKVCVWSKTASKCDELATSLDVETCDTPADLVSKCDLTFACLADAFAVKEVLFCQDGVLESIVDGKAFIDMSTIDLETATDSDYQIRRKGGAYLEARLSGTKSDAVEGSLLFMAAGNEQIYKKCSSCFQAMGRQSYFLGSVGDGTRMGLCLNMIKGSVNTAVAEGIVLAERVGMKPSDLLDLVNNCSKDIINDTTKAVVEKRFSPQVPLKHIQKDLRLAIEMADMYDQTLPVGASVNEMYKRAKSMGLGSLDMSAVYKAVCK